MNLSKDEKKYILHLVRHTIKKYFTPGLENLPKENFEVLNKENGVFVTLHSKGNLRGCIGYIISDSPLYNTLIDAAVQAAYHDPRFPPLTEKEFNIIDLEVSILSEPFKMESYDEIKLGTHGLILSENGHQGLLLPQVPVKHNMNKEEYLTALCHKAGLPSEYWKQKTLNINMFTATVFSEIELGLK